MTPDEMTVINRANCKNVKRVKTKNSCNFQSFRVIMFQGYRVECGAYPDEQIRYVIVLTSVNWMKG